MTDTEAIHAFLLTLDIQTLRTMSIDLQKVLSQPNTWAGPKRSDHLTESLQAIQDEIRRREKKYRPVSVVVELDRLYPRLKKEIQEHTKRLAQLSESVEAAIPELQAAADDPNELPDNRFLAERLCKRYTTLLESLIPPGR